MGRCAIPMKKIWLRDEVFSASVMAVTSSVDEARILLKELKVDALIDEGTDAFCYVIPNNRGWIVWMETPKHFYSLMHESVHLVRLIFEDKAINTNLSNEDETFAYYQMFWFKMLWRFFGNIKKQRKTTKKM
jgi:hypothetical protein